MENFSKKKERDESIIKLLNIHRIVDNDIFLLLLLQDYYQLIEKEEEIRYKAYKNSIQSLHKKKEIKICRFHITYNNIKQMVDAVACKDVTEQEELDFREKLLFKLATDDNRHIKNIEEEESDRIEVSDLTKGKCVRLQLLHQHLWTLIYEDPSNSENDPQNRLKKISKYPTQDFNWIRVLDISLQIPILLLFKIFKPLLKVETRDIIFKDYLNNPTNHSVNVGKLPEVLRHQLIFNRSYLFNLNKMLETLCFMGIISFAPHKNINISNKLVYLHRNLCLKDTRSLLRDQQLMKRWEKDVKSFWLQLKDIAFSTPAAYFKQTRNKKQKPSSILNQFLKTHVNRETIQVDDDGVIPGDGLGACGFDSSLFIHRFSNWTSLNYNEIQVTEDVKFKKKLNENENCKTSLNFEIVLDENQNRSERVKGGRGRKRKILKDNQKAKKKLKLEAEDGIQKAEDGIQEAEDGIQKAEDGIQEAEDGIQEAESGIQKAEDGIQKVEDEIQEAEDGIQKVEDGIQEAEDEIQKAEDGIQEAEDEIQKVEDEIQEAEDGIQRSGKVAPKVGKRLQQRAKFDRQDDEFLLKIFVCSQVIQTQMGIDKMKLNVITWDSILKLLTEIKSGCDKTKTNLRKRLGYILKNSYNSIFCKNSIKNILANSDQNLKHATITKKYFMKVFNSIKDFKKTGIFIEQQDIPDTINEIHRRFTIDVFGEKKDVLGERVKTIEDIKLGLLKIILIVVMTQERSIKNQIIANGVLQQFEEHLIIRCWNFFKSRNFIPNEFRYIRRKHQSDNRNNSLFLLEKYFQNFQMKSVEKLLKDFTTRSEKLRDQIICDKSSSVADVLTILTFLTAGSIFQIEIKPNLQIDDSTFQIVTSCSVLRHHVTQVTNSTNFFEVISMSSSSPEINMDDDVIRFIISCLKKRRESHPHIGISFLKMKKICLRRKIDEKKFNESIEELIRSKQIFVVGFNRRRLVLRDDASAWFVDSWKDATCETLDEEKKFLCRSWLSIDGNFDSNSSKRIFLTIFQYVFWNPFIQIKSIDRKFSAVINKTSILEIIQKFVNCQIFERRRCKSEVVWDFFSKFSQSDLYDEDEEDYLCVSPGGFYKLSNIFS